ncbi:MAG: hypothetical protein ACLGSD_06050 [Acidobacteriota bacterium]
MDIGTFRDSLQAAEPPSELPPALAALWWDAKGDWARAHSLIDALETPEAMAVHAYLHRKEGADWNADYWYRRAGRQFHRAGLDDEWQALVEGLAGGTC